MSKLFWLLLSAGQSSNRYMRSVMRFAVDLVPRLTQAPGEDGRAILDADAAILETAPASRPVADGRLECLTGFAEQIAHMVAWLVSVGRFPGETDTDLTIDLRVDPAADMAGDWTAEADLVRHAQACPGIPTRGRYTTSLSMAVDPVTAPPSGMATVMDTTTDLAATGAAGAPNQMSAELRAYPRMDAWSENGPPAMAVGPGAAYTTLAARMMAWLPPEWVDEETLYIRYVYETERDGNTLILR